MDNLNWICEQCGDACCLEKLENVQIETPPFDCPWGLKARWRTHNKPVEPTAENSDDRWCQVCGRLHHYNGPCG